MLVELKKLMLEYCISNGLGGGTMNYSQIRSSDVSNGEGVRVSIFTSGCDIHCYNCFNPEYQDPNNGQVWTSKTTQKLIDLFNSNEYLRGISLLGGEPTLHSEELCIILDTIKSGVLRDYDIWIYSGHLYEDLLKDKSTSELLSRCDVLVDGPYVESKRDLSLRFRGSSNQRLVSLKESSAGNVVLYDLT